MKYTYILMVGVLYFLLSCEPNKDINDNITTLQDSIAAKNARNVDKAVAVQEYNLLEDNYTLSKNEDVSKYKNFSSSAPANEHLPAILNQLFFSRTEGFEMIVKYRYYNPSSTVIDQKYDYQLSDQDYKDELGFKYPNFGSLDDALKMIPLLAANKIYKYDESTEKAIVQFVYTGAEDRYGFVTFNGTEWEETKQAKAGGNIIVDADAEELTVKDYEIVGGNVSKYKNLDSRSKKDALNTILKTNYPMAKNGDIKLIKYLYYDFANIGRMAIIKQEAGKWVKNDALSVLWSYTDFWKVKTNSYFTTESGIYAYKSEVWKYVPPMKLIVTEKSVNEKYELQDKDYELVGNGRYKNFDVRVGKGEEFEAVRVAKITKILKANTELKEGTVYEITYKVYSGSNEVWKIKLEAVPNI